MRKLLLFIILCLPAFTTALWSQPTVTLSPDLTLTEIEEDVFVVDHRYPWSANSLLVRVDFRTMVFVDTPYTPAATALVVEWVRDQYPGIGIVEINTGFHIDNLGGNAYLREQGIPIYGSDKTLELLRTRAKASHDSMLRELMGKAQYNYYKYLELTAPDNIFKLKTALSLSFGEETVKIIFPGASHAPDNICVYFPGRRLLFGGCMVKSAQAKTLGNTFDANITSWKSAVEILIREFDEVTVIPGHGTYGGTELLTHTLSLLEE
jgi:metallo-beta-lactamase class B